MTESIDVTIKELVDLWEAVYNVSVDRVTNGTKEFRYIYEPGSPNYIGWIQVWVFGMRCKHQFGGVTGDLLGTANEMVEVTLLIICALPGKSILSFTGWAWVFYG